MSAEKKVTCKGAIFTVKNITPTLMENDRALLLKQMSNDLKLGLNRIE